MSEGVAGREAAVAVAAGAATAAAVARATEKAAPKAARAAEAARRAVATARRGRRKRRRGGASAAVRAEGRAVGGWRAGHAFGEAHLICTDEIAHDYCDSLLHTNAYVCDDKDNAVYQTDILLGNWTKVDCEDLQPME